MAGVVALAGLGWVSPGQAQQAAAGREVMAKFSNAVITVRLAGKMRMTMEGRPTEEQESTTEITATLVDPSGLAVCALSEADPTQALAAMGAEQDYKVTIEITDVKMRLADGQELPAKIVLRDKDLDLAFIRPIADPTTPTPAVDLSASAKVDVLDDMLVIERLGEVANRTATASIDRVAAVIQKPRLLYVPGLGGQSADTGAAAFTLDGKVVGILVNRFPPAGQGSEERSPLTVILPAEDILDAAKQAPKVTK
jgi:hypothetical protein